MDDSTYRKSAVSTVLVMMCTLASRILGFVRTAAIGALFGAGGTADVINLVFSIPNNLRKLLAEGALSTAFIPELSRLITIDSSGRRPKSLVSTILGLQLTFILPLLAVSTFFPEQAVKLFENFSDPAKKELSAVLFRWIMPYLLFVSISAVMMAVHNTHGKFVIPAVAPLMFSICVIVSLAVSYSSWGAMSIAFGVLAGGTGQILLQYPGYHKLKYNLRPIFRFDNANFHMVMKRWLPMLLISSLFVINNQIAMLLASFLPDKSASSISYAIVFYQLPFGIFSASITTVLYPKMSLQAATHDNQGICESLGFGYRNLWALLLPSALLMMTLGKPLIAVAFQRGAFGFEDTVLTGRVLTAYSVGMPFIGIFNITQRAFYAVNQIRKPFYCALATVGIDVFLSLLFVFRFNGGSQSLAWANTLAFFIGTLLQYTLINKTIGFSIKGITLRFAGKIISACICGSLVIIAAHYSLGSRWWEEGSTWKNFWLLISAGGGAVAVILSLYIWMKVEIVSILFKKKK